MSELKKSTFAMYLQISAIFWYLPLAGIFIVTQPISLQAGMWLMVFSIFPLAYAGFGYLQAEQVASKLESSKAFAFFMSCLSLLGGGAIQGFVLALYFGDISAIVFMMALIILYGFLPSLLVAVFFIGLCENTE